MCLPLSYSMQGYSLFKMEQNQLVRWGCMGVFCVFTFMYLYFYQGDIVAVGQHILSQGQTHYNRTIGAIVVTALLAVLQTVVFRITKLEKRAHALTYFPSLLLLTFISSVGSRADVDFSFGAWPWAGPLCLVGFALLVWVAKEVEPYEPDGAGGWFGRVVWVNLMLLCLQFLLVGCLSNHDEVFHYRMRMEKLIMKEKYADALKVGKRALAADSSLTMLRAHALAAQGLLPERFFDYPVVGGAKALRIDHATVRTVLLPDSVVTLLADSSQYARDYKLMELLLDRKLGAFAEELHKSYTDSVYPKIYGEALLQYYYSSGKPFATGQNGAMEADFRDFNEMRMTTADERERYNNLKRVYGNTYWFYFRYGK